MLCIREIYCTSTLPESKHLKSLKHERGMLPADLIRGVSGGVGDRITWLPSSRGAAAPRPPHPGASVFGDGAFSAAAKVKRGGEGRVWLPGSLTGALVGSRRAGEADAESRARAGTPASGLQRRFPPLPVAASVLRPPPSAQRSNRLSVKI